MKKFEKFITFVEGVIAKGDEYLYEDEFDRLREIMGKMDQGIIFVDEPICIVKCSCGKKLRLKTVQK